MDALIPARRKGVDGFSVETPGSFAYRQFNSNFKCGHPTILPYELIRSRNRGTVGHNLRLPRAWQVLDVYAFRLITLAPPE
ncbi:hypothetical protein AVEN_260833-1 [Araneus ventricosus]|uniref:Uncharacterized protein n=1 Tax=Araneus ventricosus TaxID=182803 RepID=A0A4Y2WZQ5_ARAVE|nr:hypothetical protein AVEN_260833-1 [Araneus ventricosus]